MASFLRGSGKIVRLRSSSRLPFKEFFKTPALPTKIIPKRSYSISIFGGEGYPRRANPNTVVGGTIATCVGVWLYLIFPREPSELNEYLRTLRDEIDSEFVRQNFVSTRKNIDEGRWWTLITSTFTHFLPPHLIINMVGLWNVGRPFVLFFGAPTYALTWLGAGIGGDALRIYWPDIMRQAVKRGIIKEPFWTQEDSGSIGASGSLLGMVGVLTCAIPRNRLYITGFVVGSVLCLQYDCLQSISHKSHLGSLAIGAMSWFLFLRRRGW